MAHDSITIYQGPSIS